ncbi:MAG: pitrilysin family protein [Bacteroidota bacterium]
MKIGLILFFLVLGVPGLAQQPDRSTPPEPGPPASLTLPAVQHLCLSNGLVVMLMEKHDVPLVHVKLVVRSGAVMDPEGRAGVASMTASLLTGGAGFRDALQLSDAIEYLGASLSAAAGNHTSAVSLFTPLARFDSALVLMADVVLRPSFPASELQREQKQRLTTLIQWRDNPRSVASVLFHRQLYGEDHQYGRASVGDEQSITATTTDDVRRFHDSFYRPNNAGLIVVGDVTAASLLPKLEMLFGEWQKRPVPDHSLPPTTQVTGRKVLLVDRPGSAQTRIQIGQIGAARLTEDYYSLTVLNTILGGSFASRLNNNLREEHGYSYGAGSRFDFRPLPGPFFAAASVQSDVTDSALVEFLNELDAIREPVPEDELARAKNYVALRFPAGFQSVTDIVNQLDDLFVYGLPDDYFNTYTSRISSVTGDDVHRAAKRYIDPEHLLIVLVGDRKVIESGVKALDIGPVESLTIEDVLGPLPDLGVLD